MRKLMRLICLAAILCVAYLAFTTPREGTEPVMKAIDAETDADTDQTKTDDAKTDADTDQVKADELLDNAVTRADEAIGDVVKKADEALEDAVEQADKALADAVDSAAEGAKQGFLESLKESANEFWEKLFSKDTE